MRSLIAFFVRRRLFANLFTFSIIAMGLLTAFFFTRREAFPAVDFDVVTIMTVWPGASPSEVERLVTLPLEQDLEGVDNLETVTSVSVENRSVVVVEMNPDMSDEKQRDTVEKIQTVVNQIRDLPEDAETPIVTELSNDEWPVIELAISGDDERVIRGVAEDLEDQLLELDEVSAIAKAGWRDRQILVEVNPKTLQAYHLSLAEIAAAVRGRNVNVPGGRLKAPADEWLVRSVGEYKTADDIKPVIIRANDYGRYIQVQDVADVRDEFVEETVINRSRGKRSIDFTIIKKSDADVIRMVDVVREEVKKFEAAGLPAGVELSLRNDASYFVRRRLGILINNAIIGLLFVVVSLLIFLSLRVSFWTALGIPFSALAALMVLQWSGLTLNLISMMGFIIVIGMLVDDAVVVAENVHRHRERGLSVEEASVSGAAEVAGPIAGSVLTTMAAFLPLAFMGGIFGKFIYAIPVVVSLALAASWLESMIALPAHLAHESTVWARLRARLGLPPKPIATRASRFQKLADWYADRLVGLTIRPVARWVVVFGIGGVVLFAAGLATTMKVELFSGDGIEVFMLRAEAKAGTPLEETEELFKPIENIVAALPDNELDTYSSQIGIQRQNPTDPFTKRGSHYAQAMVFLHPESKRDRKVDEITEAIRSQIPEDSGFDKIYFTKINPGPPVGAPVMIRFDADEFETLRAVDDMVRAEMQKIKTDKPVEEPPKGRIQRLLWTFSDKETRKAPAIFDVESDLEAGKKELHVRVDDGAAAEAGLTASEIAFGVRAAFDGAPASQIRTLDEEIDIKVLFPQNVRESGVSALTQVRIPNRRGYMIPLGSVAKIEQEVGFTSIKHYDGRRTMTITADIDPSTTAVEVNKQLEPAIRARLAEDFPNVGADFSGEVSDTNESFARLGMAGLVAILIIFVIVATVFNSITRPVIVMLSIPVAVCGVIFAFFLHGQPLGFMTILGTIGLAGVVVNNQIVFVQFVNRAEEEGAKIGDAIQEAARVRLRPMMLTSVTTLVGLLPVAYGLGGSDPFVRPMALALGWGVAFSLLMTLVGLPSLIYVIDDVTRLPKWVLNTVLPPVEEYDYPEPPEEDSERPTQIDDEDEDEPSALRRVK